MLVVELGAVVGFCEVLVDDGEGESGVAVRGVALVQGQTQLKASQVQEEDFPVQNTAFFTSHRPIFFEEKSEHYA